MGLTHLSVVEQERLQASGSVTAVDLVTAAVERAGEIQPSLNCFVELWADEALERARSLDRLAVDARGALHGVPVAIKDTTPWRGHRLTLGSLTHEHHIASYTARVVERLLDAGAVIIGSTNTPEFAHSSFTDNRLWGPTRNPWNPERSSGGSSGGSAVAVATGCVALAEGTDMGGSVRIPAAWCGVVGVKPSLGRIPMDSLPGLWDSFSHHGPLARTVDDAWRFIKATQGPDRRDPYSVLAPLTGDLGVDVTGLRVALSIDLGCWEVDPEIARAVRTAAEVLEELGARVDEVDPKFSGRDEQLWIGMWGVFMAGYYGHLADEHPDLLDPDVLDLIEIGRSLSAVDVKRMEIERSDFWRRVVGVFDAHDVILCPTMSTAPVAATKADHLEIVRVPGRVTSPDMTSVWNLVSPCPAASIPVGHHSQPDTGNDGLPIGAQLIGRPADERLVLSVGELMTAAVV